MWRRGGKWAHGSGGSSVKLVLIEGHGVDRGHERSIVCEDRERGSRKEEAEKDTWRGEGKVSGMGLAIEVMPPTWGKRTDIR